MHCLRTETKYLVIVKTPPKPKPGDRSKSLLELLVGLGGSSSYSCSSDDPIISDGRRARARLPSVDTDGSKQTDESRKAEQSDARVRRNSSSAGEGDDESEQSSESHLENSPTNDGVDEASTKESEFFLNYLWHVPVEGEGGRRDVLIIMQGRSRMTIDPRIPTTPGRIARGRGFTAQEDIVYTKREAP